MSGAEAVRVGVIGAGVMGRTHLRAYAAAGEAGFACEIVAVCDADPASAAGAIAPIPGAAGARVFDDPLALLADAGVDLVSVCTPTDSHVTLALAAIRAGKHALVEKPIALTAEGVRPLAEAARSAETLCMPAMCMRFWPGWDWLAARVRDGTFGAVRIAEFRRLGPSPAWGGGFYQDHARSGGALIDFHIHDADLVRWLFGRPSAVRAEGTLEHVTTAYEFDGGPERVTAEAGWLPDPGAPFRMEFRVRFERATAEFMLGRSSALVVVEDRASRFVDLPALTGYDGEVRHALVLVGSPSGAPGTRRRAPLVTMDDALAVAELLDAERESLLTGRRIAL